MLDEYPLLLLNEAFEYRRKLEGSPGDNLPGDRPLASSPWVGIGAGVSGIKSLGTDGGASMSGAAMSGSWMVGPGVAPAFWTCVC